MVESASITITTSRGSSRGSSSGQLLVERTGLLLGVADGLDHLDPVRAGHLDGRVRAVVRDHHDPVRGPGLLRQRPQGRARTASSLCAGISTVQRRRVPGGGSPPGTASAGHSGGCSMASPRTATGPNVHLRACCRCAGSGGGMRRSRLRTCIAVAVSRAARARKVAATSATAARRTASPGGLNSTLRGRTAVSGTVVRPSVVISCHAATASSTRLSITSPAVSHPSRAARRRGLAPRVVRAVGSSMATHPQQDAA